MKGKYHKGLKDRISNYLLVLTVFLSSLSFSTPQSRFPDKVNSLKQSEQLASPVRKTIRKQLSFRKAFTFSFYSVPKPTVERSSIELFNRLVLVRLRHLDKKSIPPQRPFHKAFQGSIPSSSDEDELNA